MVHGSCARIPPGGSTAIVATCHVSIHLFTVNMSAQFCLQSPPLHAHPRPCFACRDGRAWRRRSEGGNADNDGNDNYDGEGNDDDYNYGISVFWGRVLLQRKLRRGLILGIIVGTATSVE